MGVGDFYYELAVQAIQICLATRNENGGLIGVTELLERLKMKRGPRAQEITESVVVMVMVVVVVMMLVAIVVLIVTECENREDVLTAIKSVSSLGNGFQLLQVGSRKMVLSVPMELNQDHTIVLEHAQVIELLISWSLVVAMFI